MSDPKKFSIQEVRAAKERIQLKTALRPAARGATPRRPRRLVPIVAGLIALGALSALAWAGLGRMWNRAMAEASERFQEPYLGETQALPSLAPDRDVETLMGLFKPPERHEWQEIEATARLKRTGNSRARKLLETNAAYLAEFSRIFPLESPASADLFRGERSLLNGRHDATRLGEMLVSTVAIGHVLLDSNPSGEAVLFGALRAGQLVGRGLGGQYQARALEIGQTVSTMARLSLVAHAYGGSLPPGELDRLAERLRATIPFECDYRRVLIAERDRAGAFYDATRHSLGLVWSIGEWRGVEEPGRAVEACQAECAKALEQPLPAAIAAIRAAAARLTAVSSHPLTRLASPAFALHPKTVDALSAAHGAVAAAMLVARVSRDPAPPDELAQLGLRLPKDPLTGDLFRYQRAGNGFRLWAVGADGKDDGGDETKDVLLLDATGR